MRPGPPERLKDSNPLMIQFFTWDCLHPTLSWWKHFEEEIPRLAELGVTQLWLPPPNKAAEPKGRGYDAYDLWDLGEFHQKGTIKTRWGTREELLQACRVAQEHGIDVLIDAVLNHKLGADRVETFQAVPVQPDNRLKDAGRPRDIEGWTAFDYPGRGDQYSVLKWSREHFTGVDWDHKTRTNAIYRITAPGHKGWSRNVDSELGNYDFLLGIDIDHRHPAVREDLENWGKWILETTGATGFRLDAIKHIDRKFLLSWISEYWSGNLKLILPYIRAFKGETSFFDVPLHMNFNQASRERTRYDLRRILHNTIVQVKPEDAVTFVEGQSLESWVGDNFKVQAYTIILLRGYGHPNCIGFVRKGDASHPGCAVILSNREEGATTYIHELRMNVGVEHAGKTFESHMTQHGRVEIDDAGWGTFTCFANNVQVWIKLEEELSSA
ncbi:glycoside hydrolase family 13 protein [Gymnopilus junonius]|uniref:Glycoside hydrolase family 13 protein n=1 Tax=Gymnopilus junonius TaxID=109634 RepID=A0A9P5NY77_GYMJU|nr:glycoside hydrolase family 13 protein [Gymnopilus junonius]